MTDLDRFLAAAKDWPDLDIALDALRKIALGHPCDLPVNIARAALQKMGVRQ